MKNQALFSSKDKSKKLKCRLLQFLFVINTLLKFFIDYQFQYMNLNNWVLGLLWLIIKLHTF